MTSCDTLSFKGHPRSSLPAEFIRHRVNQRQASARARARASHVITCQIKNNPELPQIAFIPSRVVHKISPAIFVPVAPYVRAYALAHVKFRVTPIYHLERGPCSRGPTKIAYFHLYILKPRAR